MKKLSIEEKELLLKDLCARLPYGVRLHISSDLVNKDDTLLGISLTEGLTPYITHNKIISTHSGYLYSAEEVKPYLRPMSSMTDEEIEIYRIIIKSLLKNSVTDNIATLYNFLNSKHLDYNGLIPLGLAIEVTEENNPYKE